MIKTLLPITILLSPLCTTVAVAQTAFNTPVITTVSGTTSTFSSIAQEPQGSTVGPASSGVRSTYNFGNNNKRLSSFTIGGTVYNRSNSRAPDAIFLRKNNASGDNTVFNGGSLYATQQAAPWKDRQIFYAEGTQSGTTFTLTPSYPGALGSAGNMEAATALLNGYVNVGIDNAFVNLEVNTGAVGDANVNANNIERIDLIWNSGIAVTAANRTVSGIIVANRGQNDDAMQLSAIKALSGGLNTGTGTNYLYSDVLAFNNAWTQKGVNGAALSGAYTPTVILAGVSTIVFRRSDNDATLGINNQLSIADTAYVSNVLAAQNISGMFLSFADLGLAVGETFYGYSILPADATVTASTPYSTRINSYLNNTIYPNNSGNAANGLDLSAINGYFAPAAILPITLSSFSLKGRATDVLLQWTTAMEENSDRFMVEHSMDAANWNTLGSVAAGGNTDIPQNYSFTDESPLNGTNYYRLKQTDRDGHFEYSSIQKITFTDIQNNISVMPNPARDAVYLKSNEVLSQVNLFSTEGQRIRQYNNFQKGTPIDIKDLLPGIYFIHIIDQKGYAIKKRFIKI
ncbi:T9SS type A sorting domain-containing protein [Taibaiella sp. KBW10]|uniref:T9SS type A sorting domain-containing protein n=1 Tax=Taibaiella sp. KBW10 TaxID=2153357 RepID=UPI00131594C8|nr:T9SS type A sorting domain-containing protein [Taibaiella sp. KBW10]